MSLELVSKCLEMENLGDNSKASKKKKVKTNDAMKVIKTDRHGIWKELRKVRKTQLKEVTKKKKKETFKSAMEIYQDEHDIDYTDKNVETLLRVSQLGKVQPADAKKILYEQPCQLSRDVKPQESTEEASIFTDEDFERFAREYKP